MDNYTIKFDGSCWPNPGGTGAYGFIIYKNNEVLDRGSGVIGTGPYMSNNYAEHWALYMGLLFFVKYSEGSKLPIHLHIVGDSLLIINHITEKHKGHKSMLYYPAYKKNIEILDKIKSSGVTVSAKWVSRDQNQECDELSKLYQTKKEQSK